jgi:hypothetical protein
MIMSKKDYNKIEVKDNMKVDVEVDNNNEELAPKPKKEMDQIITIQPKKVKRNLFSRLITGVMGPEGLPGIGAYVNEEIVKPAIKNIIFDAITSAASMAMYGDKRGPNRHHTSYNGRREPYRPNTNYSSSYNGTPERAPERIVRAPRAGIEEYVIEDRNDASRVLITLTEAADMYGSASVADYYDLIGAPSKHTDHDYGWVHDSIMRATILPVRGGYVIKFPPVEVI